MYEESMKKDYNDPEFVKNSQQQCVSVETPEQSDFSTNVYGILNDIGNMLVDKNEKYGNSALEPCRLFSKADAVEQIKIRIDDKLSRIRNENEDDDEDVVNDLIGYLVLLKIARM